MADIDADQSAPKRHSVWSVILMLLVSAVAIFIGVMGLGLYLPNMMSFARVLDSEPQNHTALAAFLFLSAGPIMAGLGLVLGWIVFAFGRRGAAWRTTLYLPLLWAIAVLAYVTIVTSFCEGSFTCEF
ncbi:MAG: hypothetical protein AAFX09_13625 [Pseudomonadota bacterium]